MKQTSHFNIAIVQYVGFDNQAHLTIKYFV